MKRKTVRIVAIVLAALIFIGVFAGALLNTFAIDSAAVVMPSTGERSKIVPVIIASAAAVVAGACFAVPKIKSKIAKNNEQEING